MRRRAAMRLQCWKEMPMLERDGNVAMRCQCWNEMAMPEGEGNAATGLQAATRWHAGHLGTEGEPVV